MTELDAQFFRPLWRRILVSVFCLIWSSLEWSSGQSFWGMVSLGLFGWCLWNFFYHYEDPEQDSHP